LKIKKNYKYFSQKEGFSDFRVEYLETVYSIWYIVEGKEVRIQKPGAKKLDSE